MLVSNKQNPKFTRNQSAVFFQKRKPENRPRMIRLMLQLWLRLGLSHKAHMPDGVTREDLFG